MQKKNVTNKRENSLYTYIHRSTSKSEKRPLEIESDDNEDDEEKRKKPRNEDEPKVMESILDDINLDDIESRITVHVLESPDSCTHEVAVYPGKTIHCYLFCALNM